MRGIYGTFGKELRAAARELRAIDQGRDCNIDALCEISSVLERTVAGVSVRPCTVQPYVDLLPFYALFSEKGLGAEAAAAQMQSVIDGLRSPQQLGPVARRELRVTLLDVAPRYVQ